MPKRGSGLDADLLDGKDASAFADAAHKHSPADLVLDSKNRLVTDVQIADWTAKETATGAQAKATQALNDAKSWGVNAVSIGSTTDPNTTQEPYILTNHANGPGGGVHWHIHTFYYSTKTGIKHK
ncbi:hypothetical protein LAV72_19275 [Lysinibacillus xylanilyticus]|uniref:hypothetical protein n=1 Tax=Lysinibacillus xylanilyticus TaxID=582475 RepID=UPI002B255980|nr:hypothetical protein [Lysinibacillus xylanilyticus]MEB2301749.1 hypothetical protein [Lysinibacillus xylanilyticus]